MHVVAHCCASAKLIIKRRKRMRASRGAGPKRPTEPRQAESWSGVGKLTIRATKRSRASRGAGPQSGDYSCSTHGIAPGILDPECWRRRRGNF
jgi:hypothetical protein